MHLVGILHRVPRFPITRGMKMQFFALNIPIDYSLFSQLPFKYHRSYVTRFSDKSLQQLWIIWYLNLYNGFYCISTIVYGIVYCCCCRHFRWFGISYRPICFVIQSRSLIHVPWSVHGERRWLICTFFFRLMHCQWGVCWVAAVPVKSCWRIKVKSACTKLIKNIQ